MNSTTPVVAFVWSDDASRSAEIDAFFRETRRSRRPAPRIEAFLATRPASAHPQRLKRSAA